MAVIVLILIVGIFSAVNNYPKSKSNKIGVVVTILPQAGFVEKLGGEKIHVTVMVPPGASPHTYEPTPSQMKEVANAEIYFKVGSGVEFELTWLDKIIKINKKIKVVDCSKGIELIKMGNENNSDDGDDPHIWLSPKNAKKIVENICNGLIQIDPENEDNYTKNKNNYLKELDDVDNYIYEKLGNFTNRNFLIYHPSFGYFAKEYNLTQISVEHKGKEPTLKVIQDCVELAKKYNLSYVYVAPQFSKKGAETIANEINGESITIDPLAKDYISNIKKVADSLSKEFE